MVAWLLATSLSQLLWMIGFTCLTSTELAQDLLILPGFTPGFTCSGYFLAGFTSGFTLSGYFSVEFTSGFTCSGYFSAGFTSGFTCSGHF